MVFSDLTFLYCFLPLTLLFYVLCPNIKAKNICLLAASLFFYAWGEPVWVFILILISFSNFYFGRLIDVCNSENNKPLAKKYLIYSIAINLSFLGVFKYLGFLVEAINMILGVVRLQIPIPQLMLPIGISFFTFQALSYIIDVYNSRITVQKHFHNFLMYISLFPQLTAGPIVRYYEISGQIEERKVKLKDLSAGATRFVAGLAKKVIIGNFAGKLVSDLIGSTVDLQSASALSVWLGILLFGIQIYFDFSGYSDMAIGLGRLFGFSFPENFNYPYIASSVTDFWRRWHITLSSFFRDYVYIPLGGNKNNKMRNLLVTWILTGFWHGASWNFIFWGLYYFVFLIFEKYVLNSEYLQDKILKGKCRNIPVIGHVYTIFIVLVGWGLFYFEDFDRLSAAFKIMFGITKNPTSLIEQTLLSSNILFIIIAIIACLPVSIYIKKILNKFSKRDYNSGRIAVIIHSVFNALILLWCTASLIGSSFNPFLYFRF